MPITPVLASITRFANTRHRHKQYFILAEYLGLVYPGTRWFTLETPEMTTYDPLNHVPWAVFRAYCSANLFKMTMLSHASHLAAYLRRGDTLLSTARVTREYCPAC